jgi:hypothetical protein
MAILKLDLVELRPEPGAETRYPFATLDWARQLPCEEVWKARKSSPKQPDPVREIQAEDAMTAPT